MKRLLQLVLHAWALALLLPAQSFEVASVKPSKSESQSSSWNTYGGGRIRMENISLKRMIEIAYDVRDYSLSGPAWLDSERFDVSATAAEGTLQDQHGPPMARFPLPMLRSLLIERFGLVVHQEPKPLSGFGLIVARKLPESHPMPLQGNSSVNSDVNSEGGRMTATNASMEQIADFFARQLGQPVQDLTGQTEVFDVKFRWTPDERSAEATADAPSIFTAVQEQLGLKLRPQKVTVQVLVVDHVERTPTEN